MKPCADAGADAGAPGVGALAEGAGADKAIDGTPAKVLRAPGRGGGGVRGGGSGGG